MKKLLNFLKKLWDTLAPLVELSIYIAIAFLISKLINVTYMQSILIVFVLSGILMLTLKLFAQSTYITKS